MLMFFHHHFIIIIIIITLTLIIDYGIWRNMQEINILNIVLTYQSKMFARIFVFLAVIAVAVGMFITY
jgi:hypothetical protein